MMTRIGFAAALAFAAVCSAAPAQTVYRCGNNSYSQTPCAGAAMLAFDASDARTPAQWAEAKAVAADERRRGREMEHARLVSEAAVVPAPAASLSARRALPRPVIAVARDRVKTKRQRFTALRQDGDFVAVAPRRTLVIHAAR